MRRTLVEQMAMRVIVGIDPETGELIRAGGVISEIQAKKGQICRCDFKLGGKTISRFYYIETLVSIEGPEQGWLEPLEIDPSRLFVGRESIMAALSTAQEAFRADDREALMRLAHSLYRCDDACADSSESRGACQRMIRIRNLLIGFAKDARDEVRLKTALLIQDCITP